jgi:hypothetical protein
MYQSILEIATIFSRYCNESIDSETLSQHYSQTLLMESVGGRRIYDS